MGNNTDPREPPDDGAAAPVPEIDIFERPSAARSEGQLYAPPKTVPPTTAHRTIEVETVKLAEPLDPRKAATVPRLRAIAPAPAPAAPGATRAAPGTSPDTTRGASPDTTPPRRARWLVGVVLVVAAAIAYVAVARMRSPAEPVSDPGNAGPARNPAARSGASPAQTAPGPSPSHPPPAQGTAAAVAPGATAVTSQPGSATGAGTQPGAAASPGVEPRAGTDTPAAPHAAAPGTPSAPRGSAPDRQNHPAAATPASAKPAAPPDHQPLF